MKSNPSFLRIPLAKANHHNQFGHSSRMPFTKTNHQPQPGNPSQMPLAEANHQAQSGHPSQMPLIEANQQSQWTFHNQFDICQQPNFIIAQLTSLSWFNIQRNTIIYPPQTSHFRTLTFSSSFQHLSRTRSTFHNRYNFHQEFNQTFHRRFIIHQGFNNISSISKSFQSINIIWEKGGNHLPVPPAGCPYPDKGLIPDVPHKTSMAIN